MPSTSTALSCRCLEASLLCRQVDDNNNYYMVHSERSWGSSGFSMRVGSARFREKRLEKRRCMLISLAATTLVNPTYIYWSSSVPTLTALASVEISHATSIRNHHTTESHTSNCENRTYPLFHVAGDEADTHLVSRSHTPHQTSICSCTSTLNITKNCSH